MIGRLALATGTLLGLTFTTLADNWPAWRGADGSGHANAKTLPVKWSATENVRWTIPLPERGNSTPVIWGDRIFLTQALSPTRQRTVMCLDRKDGKVLWQKGI